MTGHALVAAQAYDNTLVIGADMLSSITDYSDRESCILFGDGAGAVVLGAGAGGHELLDHVLHVDGSGADLIRIEAGGSRAPASHETVERHMHFLRMRGRSVFKFAVAKFAEVIEELLERNRLDLGDLALVVPHQANARILEAGAAKLGIGMERLVVNVDRLGNTSSASIPMALDEAARAGRIAAGQLVALVTFGGGLTWGGSLLRW
jgi:3-oxoacyl-[acyl-carrier-protein] synthase-3